MGAWAAHSFGNDEALDWLNDLFDERDIYFIHNTLEIIVDFPANDKPEAWDCCCALAAAEMVAAATGHPAADLPAEAKDWLEAYEFPTDDEAMTLARKAIQRIEENSWLREHWQESNDAENWYRALNDLKARLAM